MSEKWLEARLFIALKRMDILDDVMFARSVITRPLSGEIQGAREDRKKNPPPPPKICDIPRSKAKAINIFPVSLVWLSCAIVFWASP